MGTDLTPEPGAVSARTILIKIVSYRDTELLKTVVSALFHASDAERIRFAIVTQVGPESRRALEPFDGDDRFRILEVPWQEARGIGWARNITDGMRGNEDFSLQIDAHSRFAPGWDESLLGQWDALGDPRGVLSCYPGEYQIVDERQVDLVEAAPHRLRVTRLDAAGIPLQDADGRVQGLSPTELVAGGFQFAPGALCTELPQLSAVLRGDEPVQALRLFTHGYNVYVPEDIPLFHLYAKDKDPATTHSFFDEFSGDPELNARLQRFVAASDSTVRALFLGDGGGHLGAARGREEFIARTPGLASALAAG